MMTELFFFEVNYSYKNSTHKYSLYIKWYFLPYAHLYSYACVFHCKGHLTFFIFVLPCSLSAAFIKISLWTKSIIFLPCSSHSVHFCIFFIAKSSAFGLFVHSSHGSSCSIKENILLLNAPSSGTYGVWRPVNGGRLEALRNKTFRDEFSISPGSFTPWWISGCCSFIRRCNCG